MKVADLLEAAVKIYDLPQCSPEDLLALEKGDKITGYFKNRAKKVTFTLDYYARTGPLEDNEEPSWKPKASAQHVEWLSEESRSSIEVNIDGQPFSGQFVTVKIVRKGGKKINGPANLKESEDDKLTDQQLGTIGGKLEDLVPDASFDVTSGTEIEDDKYKVFFQWEAGELGEKHGKGTATFRCGWQEQTSRNILVAVNFDLLDLTGLRGVNIDQDIFK